MVSPQHGTRYDTATAMRNDQQGRSQLTKMGAIFFPTSPVGVATSSLARKCSKCLTFLTPNARRTRTQNGQ